MFVDDELNLAAVSEAGDRLEQFTIVIENHREGNPIVPKGIECTDEGGLVARAGISLEIDPVFAQKAFETGLRYIGIVDRDQQNLYLRLGVMRHGHEFRQLSAARLAPGRKKIDEHVGSC